MPTWTHGFFIVLTKPVYCLPPLSVSQSETLMVHCGYTWPIRFHSWVLHLRILKFWQSWVLLSSFSRLFCGAISKAIVRASQPVRFKNRMSFIGEYHVLGEWMKDYMKRTEWKEGARCEIRMALTLASASAEGHSGPVMSLTDVLLSLFLIQTAMAVVQLFSVRGSHRGTWALRAPSPVFTVHPVSMAGYRLKTANNSVQTW